MMKKITGTVLAGIVRSPCMTRLKASEASISADSTGAMRTSIPRWTPTPTLKIDQKQKYVKADIRNQIYTTVYPLEANTSSDSSSSVFPIK